jgi:hypothetical protein
MPLFASIGTSVKGEEIGYHGRAGDAGRAPLQLGNRRGEAGKAGLAAEALRWQRDTTAGSTLTLVLGGIAV